MAFWINYADDPRLDLGIFAFRRRLDLDTPPQSCLIHVSADQRYRLYVNDRPVSHGPQRGDLEHWFFETVDLAPHLVPGENVVWAVVWNFGWMAPVAQISRRTAFVCWGEASLETPGQWEIARVPGWEWERRTAQPHRFYMSVGPAETVDGSLVPDLLGIPGLEHLDWRAPNVVAPVREKGTIYEPFWALMPRSLPPMDYRLRSEPPVRRFGFLGDPGPAPVSEPFQSALFDQGELVCGYPRVTLSGQPGTRVRIIYDEALWESGKAHGAYGEQLTKGHRGDIQGKEARGIEDQLILGGGPTTFEPLWWRTWRYLTLRSDQEVKLEKLEVYETGYPYLVESEFESDAPDTAQIWEVAVRTAQRCAGETYFDCPYYEQLQYVGDTRIQALIHYYLSRDRRLARNAVAQFGWSLTPEGLVQSRYPNRDAQIIPTFCLWWILMLHDQMLYDGELPDFVRPAMLHRLLDAFEEVSERPGEFQHWPFLDWAWGWPEGIAPGRLKSLPVQVLLEWARHAVDELAAYLGGSASLPPRELPFRLGSDGLVQGPDGVQAVPCEHTEALYRLLLRMRGEVPPAWPKEVLERKGAVRTTPFFTYYRHLADTSSDYFGELGMWREMLAQGLTTFAETEDPARSDCHAWSAHPILGFFQRVAGVTSVAPGWARARIAPSPGSAQFFRATIAHPNGRLSVEWDEGRYVIETPVPADFITENLTTVLTAGRHEIRL